MRGWLGNGRRGAGFYALGIVLLLAVVGVSVFVGTDLLSATGEDRAKGVAPAVDRKAPKETVDQSAVVEGAFREEALSARKEAQERAAGKKAAKERAAAEKATEEDPHPRGVRGGQTT